MINRDSKYSLLIKPLGKNGLMSIAIGIAAGRSVEEKRPVAISEILD
jgi:hypothetical protein